MEVKAEFNLEPAQLWNLVENISNYPKYIKYVKYAWPSGPFEKGSAWIDFSTIIFFPVPVKHEILEVICGEKAVYLIRMPFKGSIIQEIYLKGNKNGVEFKIKANINMVNKFADFLLGRLIEKRTYEMFNKSVANFQKLSFDVS